jgi:hypothetical protein
MSGNMSWWGSLLCNSWNITWRHRKQLRMSHVSKGVQIKLEHPAKKISQWPNSAKVPYHQTSGRKRSMRKRMHDIRTSKVWQAGHISKNEINPCLMVSSHPTILVGTLWTKKNPWILTGKSTKDGICDLKESEWATLFLTLDYFFNLVVYYVGTAPVASQ